MRLLRNILTKEEAPWVLLVLCFLGTLLPFAILTAAAASRVVLVVWIFLAWCLAIGLQFLRNRWLRQEHDE